MVNRRHTPRQPAAGHRLLCTEDLRACLCHPGGTPNLTDDVRAIPNVEFNVSWFGHPPRKKTMPREIFDTLSEHAQMLCADVVAQPGEVLETCAQPAHRPRLQICDYRCPAVGC